MIIFETFFLLDKSLMYYQVPWIILKKTEKTSYQPFCAYLQDMQNVVNKTSSEAIPMEEIPVEDDGEKTEETFEYKPKYAFTRVTKRVFF